MRSGDIAEEAPAATSDGETEDLYEMANLYPEIDRFADDGMGQPARQRPV